MIGIHVPNKNIRKWNNDPTYLFINEVISSEDSAEMIAKVDLIKSANAVAENEEPFNAKKEIHRLNKEMDIVLENQKKMLNVLRKLVNEPVDTPALDTVAVESLMDAEDNDTAQWKPQEFPLSNVEQLQTVEDELADQLKAISYVSNAKSILILTNFQTLFS